MKTYDLKNISRVFKQAKAAKGCTVRTIEQATGISHDTIVNISGGKTCNPRVETLLKLSTYLGVPLQEFLENE